MSTTFPFRVAAAKAPADDPRQFAIIAPVGELEGYYNLFEDFGYGGNGPSWREHIETILEEHQPELLDHLEFDEEGETFLAYADSLDAVRQFMGCILPYFGDLEKLKKYLSQTDSSDFFE
jgi:hypothetical protein